MALEDDAGAKRKRKQLTSCDCCRLRRVKCVRDAADEVCQGCREKNIACTSNYISNRPKAQRTGKRIEAARQQFGAAASASPPSRASPRTSASTPPTSSDFTSPQELPKEHVDSMLLMMAGKEPAPPSSRSLVEATKDHQLVSKQLVDDFREVFHAQCPVINWDTFYCACIRAGFEAHSMPDPEDEVMLLAVQAMGARVSDHPAVVGEGVSRKCLPKDTDLSVYGQRREGFCFTLLEQALRMYDIRGISRRVSGKSTLIMSTLAWLLETSQMIKPTALAPHDHRLMMAMALQHMRIMVESPHLFSQDDKRDVLNGKMFWNLFVGDSLTSAVGGRLPLTTLEDVKLFAPAILSNPDPLEQLNSQDPQKIAAFFALRLFGGIAMLARRVFFEVTGPIARQRKKLDKDGIRQIWKQCEDLDKWTEMFAARMSQKLGSGRAGDLLPNAEIWAKCLQCCTVDLLHTIDMRVKEVVNNEEPEVEDDLSLLSEESANIVFKVLRRFVDVLRLSVTQSQALAFGGILLRSLCRSTQCLLAQPASNYGGIDRKIADIEVMVGVLKVASFAWPTGEQLESCEAELEVLKKADRELKGPASALMTMTGKEPEPVFAPVPQDQLLPNNPFDSFMVPTLFPTGFDFAPQNLSFDFASGAGDYFFQDAEYAPFDQ